jgi:beta-phosphoglucomutase-like phosphatase (HAD superfamily)
MNCSPGECLVVEDSNAGVMAAHRAGMRIVMVPDVASPEPASLEVVEEVVAAIRDSSCLNALLKEGLSPRNKTG